MITRLSPSSQICSRCGPRHGDCCPHSAKGGEKAVCTTSRLLRTTNTADIKLLLKLGEYFSEDSIHGQDLEVTQSRLRMVDDRSLDRACKDLLPQLSSRVTCSNSKILNMCQKSFWALPTARKKCVVQVTSTLANGLKFHRRVIPFL